MIVTSMQLTISSRRDIAVLQKESSSLEGEEDVNRTPFTAPTRRECVSIQDATCMPTRTDRASRHKPAPRLEYLRGKGEAQRRAVPWLGARAAIHARITYNTTSDCKQCCRRLGPDSVSI